MCISGWPFPIEHFDRMLANTKIQKRVILEGKRKRSNITHIRKQKKKKDTERRTREEAKKNINGLDIE